MAAARNERGSTTSNPSFGSEATDFGRNFSEGLTTESYREATAQRPPRSSAVPPGSEIPLPESKAAPPQTEAPPESVKFDFDPQPEQGPPIAPRTLGDARAMCRSEAAQAIVSLAARLERKVDEAFAVPALGFVYGGVAAESTETNSQRRFGEWLRSQSPDAVSFLEKQIEVDAPAGDVALLSSQASHVIVRAITIARQTVSRDSVDARHIVAALVARGDPVVEAAVIAPVLDAIGVDLRDFCLVMLDWLDSEPYEADEKPEAWATILAGRPTFTRPDYAADRPEATTVDTLNIGPDVTAFAELICLETARPPLSIGLFGDWGSGKTFFMERLKESVDRVAESARRTLDDGEETPFVPHVAQIRFNAWHYADANLWASLTAEFFDQLRVGGIDAKVGAAYDRLVGRVAGHVRSLESEVTAWETARVARAKEVADKQREVTEAAEALEETARSEAKAAATSAIRAVIDRNKAGVARASKALFGEDLSEDPDGLADKAADVLDLPGKIALIFKGFAHNPVVLLVVTALLVALAGVGYWLTMTGGLISGGLEAFVVRYAPLLAALGAVASGFWKSYQLVKPVLDGASALSQRLAETRESLAKNLEEKQEELAKAKDEMEEADKKLAAARRKVSPYPEGDGKLSQASLLRYFLFEDEETKGYDQHLGIVSRVRRSFETLDSLASAGREAAAAVAQRKAALPADGPPPELSPQQREQEAAAEEYNAGRSTPHRIVLYIDDLDRCTHEQVYQVLQAVHLLLAFELFVVVVGVDVRWVEDALTRFFARAGDGAEGSPNRAFELLLASQGETAKAVDVLRELQKESDRALRQRASAYLEKIFQIPFWLRPLSTEGSNNTYANYVDGLLAANQPADDAGPGGGAARRSGDGTGPLPVEATEPLEDDDRSLERVILTEDEITLLRSAALGALAGSSPRAIKRFINIYRIVRGRQGANLRRFTGEDGSQADFPIVSTILALETGASGADAAAFHRALATESDAGDSLFELVTDVRGGRSPLALVCQRLPALAGALEEAEEMRGPISREEWLSFTAELRRYSFHRREEAS